MSNYTLNPEQLNIINHINGAILVLAPVGTGKTQVLSERVIKAINNGIDAKKILCLTFTNRAAKEMSHRLAQTCPNEYRYITIKTFHALCTSILRSEARYIGLPVDFTVYDDEDCISLIKDNLAFINKKDAQSIYFKISDCKSKSNRLNLGNLEPNFSSLNGYQNQLALKYQKILQERHGLDFADLIFYVRAMFYSHPEIKQKWEHKFNFIQVDEVQDTHLSEYEIVRFLAKKSGNLAMIGDLDQTIYQWRGSEPAQVIGQFKQDFQPQEYALTWNYRATQTLLNAASKFADSFEHRYTKITPAPSCEIGENIITYTAQNENDEVFWIGNQIKALANNNSDFAYNKVAILTRNHNRINLISKILQQMNIPCVTIEQYQFFQRQEIKDTLAYIRLILNPFDIGSMRRILLRPSRGIGDLTIENIIKEGENCGFRLTDMLLTETFIDGDPFSNLLTAYYEGKIVVFDVETTGLSVSEDEVIEIAAIKLIKGKIISKFHGYIKNTVSVGDSQLIHGYSDHFLAENGMNPIDVFSEFFTFTKDALWIGHNVSFDIKMIVANASKLGLEIPKFLWADTWNLANRFIFSDQYSLENLATQLNLNQSPNHHAMDDTLTTVELLEKLIPLIQEKSQDRQVLVSKYGEKFEILAEKFETWRDASQKIRPANLLMKITIESRLYDFYQKTDLTKFENLKNLILQIFQQQDNQELHPDTALRSILEYTALAKNLDQISQDNNQIPIMTVHQAKGLEFDTVFLAGLCDGEFPNYYSIKDGTIEEERRLFYVAITRAKKRLFMSYYLKDNYNYLKSISRFIN
jgi:DNA helicase II / ATP-dependent DNA helicase PcrA